MPLGFRLRAVTKEEYGLPVGVLAGVKGLNEDVLKEAGQAIEAGEETQKEESAQKQADGRLQREVPENDSSRKMDFSDEMAIMAGFSSAQIDAFIHAIESYVSPKATLYTQMFSMKAMEMIIEGFRKIAEHGEEYRMNLLDDFLTASNLAGIAFGNAGTGAVHAMSYPLSGVYHVTHGEANYQFLTAVFAKYQELDPNGRIKKLNNFLSNILKCKSDEVYTKIEKLLDQIIARKPLHEYGMKEEEIESFAKTVEETQQRLLNQSYVKLTWQQMAEIYKELY